MKYLSQEFDINVLNLVKQKWFYRYEYMRDFESLNKNYVAKKGFIALADKKKLVTKNMNMFLIGGKNLKWKGWRIITTCI